MEELKFGKGDGNLQYYLYNYCRLTFLEPKGCWCGFDAETDSNKHIMDSVCKKDMMIQNE